MNSERRHVGPHERIAALKRHLLEGTPVSTICDELGIAPTLFYRWQKELFENGHTLFENGRVAKHLWRIGQRPFARARRLPAVLSRSERSTRVPETPPCPLSANQKQQADLGEIGTDLSRFPSEKNFVSWLGLCPQHRGSAGKIFNRRGANRAARALQMAGQGCHHAKNALGAFYRRIQARCGGAKAVRMAAVTSPMPGIESSRRS